MRIPPLLQHAGGHVAEREAGGAVVAFAFPNGSGFRGAKEFARKQWG